MHEDVHTTLHDSAAFPKKLSYVLLFKGANPRWDSDGIVFAKSSLELLPPKLAEDDSDEVDGGHTITSATNQDHKAATDSSPPPIAIYAHTGAKRARAVRNFKFAGNFKIDKLTFLEPHSRELARMLEQKWSVVDKRGNAKPRQRSTEAWEASIRLRWAVVKFKKDEAANEEKDVPKIERVEVVEDWVGERKGVTEMLREMRLKEDATGKVTAGVKLDEARDLQQQGQEETAEKT